MPGRLFSVYKFLRASSFGFSKPKKNPLADVSTVGIRKYSRYTKKEQPLHQHDLHHCDYVDYLKKHFELKHSEEIRNLQKMKNRIQIQQWQELQIVQDLENLPTTQKPAASPKTATPTTFADKRPPQSAETLLQLSTQFLKKWGSLLKEIFKIVISGTGPFLNQAAGLPVEHNAPSAEPGSSETDVSVTLSTPPLWKKHIAVTSELAFDPSSDDATQEIVAGIVDWGEPFKKIMKDIMVLLRQAANHDTMAPLVTVLLDGLPQSGKTAIAAKLALDTVFPFVRVVSPERMIGLTDNAKAMAIKQVFDDAYKSPLSLIIMDDIEKLVEYSPVGHRCSRLVRETLLECLKTQPPKATRLVVMGTTSKWSVVTKELEMLGIFNTTMLVPILRSSDHLITALERSNSFTKDEITELKTSFLSRERLEFFIGMKQLLAMVKIAKLNEASQHINIFQLLLEELKVSACSSPVCSGYLHMK